jgi:hypothetical protein
VSARTEAELARKEDFVGRSLAGPSIGGTDAGVELPRPRAWLMSSEDSWLRLQGGRPSCLLGPDSWRRPWRRCRPSEWRSSDRVAVRGSIGFC